MLSRSLGATTARDVRVIGGAGADEWVIKDGESKTITSNLDFQVTLPAPVVPDGTPYYDCNLKTTDGTLTKEDTWDAAKVADKASWVEDA
ncbi:uncharacterized protein I303_106168 [Kwoniella dejecticola CBS 10117]|uniref:Uncharacterized protein n=1 Tax=Kwoniella dejecticola CBS 10117 TaxID=1296121 RepID=A0A1A6A1G3_9TREE|nr:uncharacterized protein I303_06186 [Kwoniella dejecticola CBS 10117]OBR83901.1 hypothetical protein I303_06186 [Kwoniella dejecticola CBS 10117]